MTAAPQPDTAEAESFLPKLRPLPLADPMRWLARGEPPARPSGAHAGAAGA